MEELANLERQRGNPEYLDTKCPNRRASREMCTFLILNISSLELVPVSIIACRRQYGSANPTAVIVPGLIATSVSTLTAIVFCKILERKGCENPPPSFLTHRRSRFLLVRFAMSLRECKKCRKPGA